MTGNTNLSNSLRATKSGYFHPNVHTQRPSKKLDWKRLGPLFDYRTNWTTSVPFGFALFYEDTSSLPRLSPRAL